MGGGAGYFIVSIAAVFDVPAGESMSSFSRHRGHYVTLMRKSPHLLQWLGVWKNAGVVGVAERNCLQVYLQDNEEAEERSETERYWPLSNTRCDKSVLG